MADKLAMKVATAAEALDVSKTTMYELIASGQIKALRVGKDYRVTPEALNDYIQRQQDK